MYKYPIALTQQFRFCGNPFRVDLYKGCDFGCKYCFANSRNGGFRVDFDEADFSIVEQYFYKAFETEGDTKDVTIELMRHRVPFHVGGMSDPFQTREVEDEMHLTYKLIELSNKYDYPLIFSTKRADLPKEYWDILNPELHAFQVSIIGYDDEYSRQYETNTPTPKQRIEFIKELHSKGFWSAVRIQPLIDLDQAIKVCQAVDGIADFIVVEHLKIPADNKTMRELFVNTLNMGNYAVLNNMRNFELKQDIKISNINKIKEVLKTTPIGCGDNDLHYMSQSRNCCGLDTIPSEKFKNWLKYNLTYFTTQPKDDTEDMESLYIPQGSVSSCLNPHTRLKGINDFKTYTDYYCYKNLGFMCTECPMYDKYKNSNMSELDGGRDIHKIRLW